MCWLSRRGELGGWSWEERRALPRCTLVYLLNRRFDWRLPRWLSDRVCLPMQKTWVQSLAREDPTCCWAAKSCSITSKPVHGIWSYCSPRAQSPCSAAREATAVRRPGMAPGQQLCLPQREKSPGNNEDPAQPNVHNKVLLSRFSRVRLFANPWTVVRQAPLSIGFSRQEYWSGLPFSSPNKVNIS